MRFAGRLLTLNQLPIGGVFDRDTVSVPLYPRFVTKIDAVAWPPPMVAETFNDTVLDALGVAENVGPGDVHATEKLDVSMVSTAEAEVADESGTHESSTDCVCRGASDSAATLADIHELPVTLTGAYRRFPWLLVTDTVPGLVGVIAMVEPGEGTDMKLSPSERARDSGICDNNKSVAKSTTPSNAAILPPPLPRRSWYGACIRGANQARLRACVRASISLRRKASRRVESVSERVRVNAREEEAESEPTEVSASVRCVGTWRGVGVISTAYTRERERAPKRKRTQNLPVGAIRRNRKIEHVPLANFPFPTRIY